MLRALLVVVSLLLAVVFGAAFSVTYVAPEQVERAAVVLIRERVEAAANERIESLGGAGLHSAAAKLRGEHAERIDAAKEKLRAELPRRVADAIARMQDLSCECRRWLERSLQDGLEAEIGSLSDAKQALTTFLEASYAKIVQNLIADVRIFTGTTTLALLLVAVLALVRSAALPQLLLPATLLLVAALVSAWFYVFQQNWFFAIVYNDYVGLAYAGYVAGVFAFLCDVALNRARVTTQVVNAILQGIGSSLSLVPC